MDTTVPVKKKHGDLTFILLLTLLILLRFPLLIMASFNLLPITNTSADIIFTVGTYLATAAVILLKRDSLIKYNIGFLSVVLFIVAPIIYPAALFIMLPKMPLFLTDVFIRPVISVCLLAALIKLKVKLPRAGLKKTFLWLIAAVTAGITFGIISGLFLRMQTTVFSSDYSIAKYLPCAFFLQLNNAAACEEPLFRGFLWGFLRELHWKDYWILIFQAILFMLGHIYYLGTYNYSFFVIVPICALILGVIAWRSKSIGASMITHSFINSVGDIVGHFNF